MRIFFGLAIALIYCLSPLTGKAQLPDSVYMPSIHSVKLFVKGDQTVYPILALGASEGLELHFDDFDNYVKNFNYTFQLCNADWKPVSLSIMDYMQGFTQNRFTQYRQSSIAKTNYIHYQVTFPNRNSMPTKSGNYLLKVFLNGDTSKLAFTSRFMIYESVVSVAAQLTQPFNPDMFRTHQKIQFTVDKSKLNIINPQQQLKVVVLQNFRWDNATKILQPTFMRGNLFEYNNENELVFPAGKEYRWADLRSFRFQSERVASINMSARPFEVVMQPDAERTQLRFVTYRDLNGFYEISSTESINPWWQGDYANVNFILRPNGNQPYAGKDVYIVGQFTGYKLNEQTKLNYNANLGVYEKTLLLKQGYYTYTYVTKDLKDGKPADATQTDGNYWETENDYTILVYYRDLSGRHDQLVAVTTVNSRNFRTGL
ncbi:DUF5103 domain-containing protein [Foetidibacter luteolus]|uniref:type IX secretion system plug protein n=1 Tax=Foetidibacter luteolus TaxID=2608880 RepID=UPI00129BC7D6|nr:DUF5103 domain-containing protein [Foetidibacter luteolus]